MPHPNRLKITVRILIFICLGCFIFSSCTPVSRNTIGDPSAEEAKSDVQVAPLSETPKAGNPSGDKKEFPPEKTPVKTSPPLGKTLSSTNGNLSKKICNSTNAKQSLNDNRAITEMQLSSEDKMDESSFSNGDEALDVTIGTDEDEDEKERDVMEDVLVLLDESHNHWIKGELDDALQMLDQAYAFLLDADGNPEIARQKDDLRLIIAKKILAIFNSIQTPAKGMRGEIPLISNDAVEKEIRSFQTIERDFFVTSYQRSMIYRPVISNELKRAGLPDELSWLPLVESGFKINALSPARALGLWQFIPSTGYKYGLNRDYWVDERMDIEKSTKAALAYLKDLHAMFGDWLTVLAAYNCGEGRVLRCIQTQRINYLDNFWDLYERLPMETAFYVPRFLAVLHILKDPEAHGLTLPAVDEEVETEAVTIDKQAHLKTIAQHTGVPYDLLAEINPSLRHDFTPDRPFSFKMPKGKGQVLLSNVGDIPVWHPPVPAYVVHKVRIGETLSAIARRYGTSVSSIMRLNSLKSSHFIRAGWRLKIPTSRKYEIQRAESSGESTSPGRAGSVRYAVQKGDSLWRIAQRFGTTTNAIQSVNRLKDTHLSIGQILLIPKGPSTAEEIQTKTYIVSKGDSPYLIAKRNRMELSQFLNINNLSPRSTIFPGQVLLVRAE